MNPHSDVMYIRLNGDMIRKLIIAGVASIHNSLINFFGLLTFMFSGFLFVILYFLNCILSRGSEIGQVETKSCLKILFTF